MSGEEAGARGSDRRAPPGAPEPTALRPGSSPFKPRGLSFPANPACVPKAGCAIFRPFLANLTCSNLESVSQEWAMSARVFLNT
jgi:hypothetical protein